MRRIGTAAAAPTSASRHVAYDRCEVIEATLDDIDEAKLRWYLERAAQERGIPIDTMLPTVEDLKRLEDVPSTSAVERREALLVTP